MDTQSAPASDKNFFAGNFQSPQFWPVSGSSGTSVHFKPARTTLSSLSSPNSTVSLTHTFNTTGWSNISMRLQASQSASLFSSGDFLKIEVNDGSGWQRLLTDAGYFQGLDDATPESSTPVTGNTTPAWTDWIALPIGAGTHHSVQIRITCQLGSGGEQYFLNQFLLVGKKA